MVTNNVLSEIGDVLFVEAQAIIAGNVIELSTFSDTLVGETVNRFFTKQFRVSTNGVIYTPWAELTVPNLNAINGLTGGILYLQFAYERAGTDPTGLLEFDDVQVNGSITAFVCNGTTTHLSIFDSYACSNVYTAELCNNLLKKLYEKGIVPEYIVRGDGESDADYIAFWQTIACYFSMFVSFMKDFDNIINKRDWLIEYLSEKGMYVCADDVSLADLQYLASHFYDEIRKRGTIQIVKKKGELRQDGSTVPIDGELLRLVCWNSTEEFLFCFSKPQKQGWNVGNSSPMFRQTLFDDQLIKGYETTKDFVVLSKYPRLGTSYQSIVTQSLFGNDIDSLRVNAIPQNTNSGIGSFPQTDFTKAITVSPYLDYEITAFVRMKDITKLRLVFGLRAYDKNNNQLSVYNIDGSGATGQFWNLGRLPLDKYFFLRGILFAKGTTNRTGDDVKLNVMAGNNLRFNFDNTAKIIPFLYFRNVAAGNSGEAFIWDFKIRPLRTDYSSGFLNSPNLLKIWAKNNNAKYSNEVEENIVRKSLVPYQAIPKHNWIGQESAPDGTENKGYYTIDNDFISLT